MRLVTRTLSLGQADELSHNGRPLQDLLEVVEDQEQVLSCR